MAQAQGMNIYEDPKKVRAQDHKLTKQEEAQKELDEVKQGGEDE